MADSTTKPLLAAASRGEQPAIDQLVASHLPRLRAYVRLRMGKALRGREETQDLVQSVCRELIVHQERFEYRDEEQFLGWLFTTALLKVREKQRFHGREARDVRREAGPLHADDLAIAHLLTPSREAIGCEQLQRVTDALAELSDDHREVIGLARIAGLSHREIAARMQRTEAATRQLLGRALAQLGETLAAGGSETLGS